MANNIIITANWADGTLSNGMLSRQYDNNRYVVQFTNYPLGEDEDLSLYLVVWMKTEENGQSVEQAPIELESDQWIITNYYTQFVQSMQFQLCVKNESGTFEAHSPIFNGNVTKSLNHNGSTQEIYVNPLFDPYREYVDELVVGAGAVVIDDDLDTAGAAADAKAVGDRIAELEQGGTGGLTADIKTALLACFNHVAWDAADPTGQSYINALQTALYPPANLSRITAVYTQSGTVWSTDTLDSLKNNLVVTAYYDNSTSEVISNYTLSGTLSEGTRTITVSYGNKTATFNVVVTRADNSVYNWDFTSSLVDSKQNVEAVLTGATRDSNGVTFNALTDFISLCDVSAYNTGQFTVEIDFGDFIATAANQYPVCLATGTGFTTYNGIASQNNGWMIYRPSNTKKYFTDIVHDVFDNATLKFVYDISGENVWRVYADDVMVMEDTAPHSNLNNRKRLGIAFLPANSVVKAVRVYAGVV